MLQKGHTRMNDILFDIARLIHKVQEQPASRERACLLTKLDEARHWARDMKDLEIPSLGREDQ
jgi:hypothetical protein